MILEEEYFQYSLNFIIFTERKRNYLIRTKNMNFDQGRRKGEATC